MDKGASNSAIIGASLLIVGGTVVPTWFNRRNTRIVPQSRDGEDDRTNNNSGRGSDEMLLEFRTRADYALFHTFKHVAGSLATTAGAAVLGHHLGVGEFLSSLSPPISFILTAAPLFFSMNQLMNTPRENDSHKRTMLTTFNVLNGLSCAAVYGLVPSELLLRAGGYTTILFGSLSAGAMLGSFSSTSLALPTTFGLASLGVVSFLEMFFTNNRVLREYNLYVGLLIVMAASLYDMKLLQERAEADEDVEWDRRNAVQRTSLDYINESVRFYLSFLNLFMRILAIIIDQQIKKRKKEIEEEQRARQQQQQQQQRVRYN